MSTPFFDILSTDYILFLNYTQEEIAPTPSANDNILITLSESDRYRRPLVVWCVTAKEGEHYAKNSGKALLW